MAILGDISLVDQVATVAAEIVSLAEKSGVPLPSDIIAASVAKARAFPPETKTSFQRDFERPEKSDERNLFAGAVLTTAQRLGVETPTAGDLAERLEKLKPWASIPKRSA